MAKHCTVGKLEQLLLHKYPVQDAENWDKTGLLVGDPARVVTGVVVALDPTFAVLEQAKKAGANVVLTHHPAFLQAPERFLPRSQVSETPDEELAEELSGEAHEELSENCAPLNVYTAFGVTTQELAGALVYAAINDRLALMNFHTALDMNEEGLMALPVALGLTYEQTMLPLNPASKGRRGYGALCKTATKQTVHDLASQCKQVLRGNPRIWGNTQREVQRVVTAQGSATTVLPAALERHVDCLICGELKYHDALAAAQAGLSIIELGHDISEQLLVDVLYKAVKEIGIENVVKLDYFENWTTL